MAVPVITAGMPQKGAGWGGSSWCLWEMPFPWQKAPVWPGQHKPFSHGKDIEPHISHKYEQGATPASQNFGFSFLKRKYKEYLK